MKFTLMISILIQTSVCEFLVESLTVVSCLRLDGCSLLHFAVALIQLRDELEIKWGSSILVTLNALLQIKLDIGVARNFPQSSVKSGNSVKCSPFLAFWNSSLVHPTDAAV